MNFEVLLVHFRFTNAKAIGCSLTRLSLMFVVREHTSSNSSSIMKTHVVVVVSADLPSVHTFQRYSTTTSVFVYHQVEA